MNEKITLYSHGCPRCKILSKKLDAAGIEYEVFSDVDAMVAMGFKEAPKLKVGDVVMGYKEAVEWVKEQ